MQKNIKYIVINNVRMTSFLKLTFAILNKNSIRSIYIKPQQFHIHTTRSSIDGFTFFGSGGFETSHEKLIICEKKDPDNYKTIQKWINEL